MNDIEYANAYREVIEILKYIPIDDYNKIPKNKIRLYEANANYDYDFEYNPEKTLNEQNVSKITKGIIAILFRDYWANNDEKEVIIAKQNYNRQKLEEKKRQKYNSDNLFNKVEETSEDIEITLYKESVFKRIKKWFMKIIIKQ